MNDPEWRTFECEDCGEVEEIDISEDSNPPQICSCGAEMHCIDVD